MSKKLRLAVIGAGTWGRYHVGTLRQCDRATVVGICDTDRKRVAEAKKMFGLAVGSTDYRQLLTRDDIDAVNIVVPNCYHAEIAIAALRAGKHVYLEKPMATNAREAARIVAAAKKSRRTFMVGQSYRFQQDPQLLKQLVDRGLLGDIYHARAWCLRRTGIPVIGSWFTQKKYAGAGALFDIGVHALDLGLHLMGSFEPVSVMGVTHARFGPRGIGGTGYGKLRTVMNKGLFDVDDYAAATIRLKGGGSLMLEAAWVAHVLESSMGVELFGTKGGGAVSPARIYRRSRGLDAYEVINPEASSLPYPRFAQHHFVDCVLDRKKPLVEPRQSLMVQKILDGILKSARTGRSVTIARSS